VAHKLLYPANTLYVCVQAWLAELVQRVTKVTEVQSELLEQLALPVYEFSESNEQPSVQVH